MTQKPEWFEMVDGDEQISDFIKPAKAGKRVPVTVVLASAAIIVGGAFFANANGETSANAETVSAASSTTATAPADPSASSSTSTPSAQNGITNPSTNNGDAPAIGNLPQRGGDDEGDDHFGNHGDRPRHEGEHHGDRLPPAGDDSGEDD